MRENARKQNNESQAEVTINITSDEEVDKNAEQNLSTEVKQGQSGHVNDLALMMQAMSPGSLAQIHHTSQGQGQISENGLKVMMTGQEPEDEGYYVVYTPAVSESVFENLKKKNETDKKVVQYEKSDVSEDKKSKEQTAKNGADHAEVKEQDKDKSLLTVYQSTQQRKGSMESLFNVIDEQ